MRSLIVILAGSKVNSFARTFALRFLCKHWMENGLLQYVTVDVRGSQNDKGRLQVHSTGLTLSLTTSFFIRSLSLCALASLCRSEWSFRSRLRVYAAGDAESFILDDTRALALSDRAVASLSSREGGTLSATLKVTSFAWIPTALSTHLLGESSAGATPAGSEQSE